MGLSSPMPRLRRWQHAIKMALDIYFQENIARVLVALNTASGSTAALVCERMALESPDRQLTDLADHVRIYRQGYRDALGAVGMAFGIVATQEVGGIRLIQE